MHFDYDLICPLRIDSLNIGGFISKYKFEHWNQPFLLFFKKLKEIAREKITVSLSQKQIEGGFK